MELQFSGPRYSAMIEQGAGLDAIGALIKVELPRQAAETDQAYRERLIVKLDWLCGVGRRIESRSLDDFQKWKVWFEGKIPIDVDGLRYLVQSICYEHGNFEAWLVPCVPLVAIDHEWRGPMAAETTAPTDVPKFPNHIRDAIEANR